MNKMHAGMRQCNNCYHVYSGQFDCPMCNGVIGGVVEVSRKPVPRKQVYINAVQHSELKEKAKELDLTIQDFLELILDIALNEGLNNESDKGSQTST